MDDESTFLRLELKHAMRLVQLQAHLLKKADRPVSVSAPMERLIRMPEVVHLTGLSKRTIHRLEETGRFPRRRQLGRRAVGWPEHFVSAWIRDPAGWRLEDQSLTQEDQSKAR
jgi:prophage regulatory protein